jgi:hypothetical protein
MNRHYSHSRRKMRRKLEGHSWESASQESAACHGDPTPLRTIITVMLWRAVRPSWPSALPRRFRHLSNASAVARYPSIEDFASKLAQTQPSFSVPSENVLVLSTPDDFYTRLIVRHQSGYSLAIRRNYFMSRT